MTEVVQRQYDQAGDEGHLPEPNDRATADMTSRSFHVC
jgi:hypothetical protein